jgi:hypothetical protein
MGLQLWQDVDMLMVQELTTTHDFFDKVLGFHDLFSTITKQPVKSWKRRRLLTLSVLPLLMAIIVSASLLLCRIRSLSTFFRIPCLDRSCMDLFPTDMVRNCSVASNSTFVWSEQMPDSDYGYNFGCLYCSILIDGTHDRHNLILLHSLGKSRIQFIFENLTALSSCDRHIFARPCFFALDGTHDYRALLHDQKANGVFGKNN